MNSKRGVKLIVRHGGERGGGFEYRIGQLLSLFLSHRHEILKNKEKYTQGKSEKEVVSTCLHSEDSGKGVSRSL